MRSLLQQRKDYWPTRLDTTVAIAPAVSTTMICSPSSFLHWLTFFLSIRQAVLLLDPPVLKLGHCKHPTSTTGIYFWTRCLGSKFYATLGPVQNEKSQTQSFTVAPLAKQSSLQSGPLHLQRMTWDPNHMRHNQRLRCRIPLRPREVHYSRLCRRPQPLI